MKIGYPCINLSLDCKANATFRLKSFSEERFIQTVGDNLTCLKRILEFNVKEGFNFFRISSDLIPFASHPICNIAWEKIFLTQLTDIGQYIRQHKMRISMHPSQFVLINSPHAHITKNSLHELAWHTQLLDSLGLTLDAKVQIHVGGIYGDKSAAMQRFITQYQSLPNEISRRLVIENDDRLFSFADCFYLYEQTGIPIIVDNFHHECLHHSELIEDILVKATRTWKKRDGKLMVDYSSQAPNERKGKHVDAINAQHFSLFIERTQHIDYDLMLEIKNKEKSAFTALEIAKKYRSDL